VCAPSNIAVDNVVERLAAAGSRCVRLGHPARLLPAVLAHCLDARILHSDEGQLVRDVKKELDAILVSGWCISWS
jgi:superfamily I DNA and/or RNA helicase